jgi:hypothetical protein
VGRPVTKKVCMSFLKTGNWSRFRRFRSNRPPGPEAYP